MYMMFKKDEILRKKYLGLIYAVIACILLCLIIFLGNNSLLYLFLYVVGSGVVGIGGIIFLLLMHCADIIMNDTGISCKKCDKQLWNYKWSEVEELKHTKAYGAKALCVVSKDGTAQFKEQMGLNDTYFQLGKSAKKALARYCIERADGSFVVSIL